jgi:carbamoyl-phosphate synthase large subunit
LADGSLRFPLIVKPRFGFGSTHTYVAKNGEQLDVFFRIGPEMIVQPKVEGDDYDFDICNDLDGRPLSVVLWRKFRSTMGETENVITVKNDRLLSVGERLGRALGHVGPMDVDLFVDAEGSPSIIEMNPRFGGGYPVSHLAGADFPGMLIRLIRGESVAPRIGDYRDGFVMMKSLEVFGGADVDFWSNQLHLSP